MINQRITPSTTSTTRIEPRRGRLITLEGGEGLGKSTQVETVRQLLTSHGIETLVTREPGGTPLGERLRSILLERDLTIAADSELLMMFAARAQHLQSVITPALERGIWVVCDRFTDASYAYQGGGGGLHHDRIAVIEEWVQGGLRPDRVLLFDAAVEVGMQRARLRGALDRFESQGEPFLRRVRDAYLQRAAADPSRYSVIDASRSVTEVAAAVTRAVTPMMNS